MNLKHIVLSGALILGSCPDLCAIAQSPSKKEQIKETKSIFATFKNDMKCMWKRTCTDEQNERIFRQGVLLLNFVLLSVVFWQARHPRVVHVHSKEGAPKKKATGGVKEFRDAFKSWWNDYERLPMGTAHERFMKGDMASSVQVYALSRVVKQIRKDAIPQYPEVSIDADLKKIDTEFDKINKQIESGSFGEFEATAQKVKGDIETVIKKLEKAGWRLRL